MLDVSVAKMAASQLVQLYAPEEWQTCVADKTSFAYQINSEGVVLHG